MIFKRVFITEIIYVTRMYLSVMLMLTACALQLNKTSL